MKLGVRANRNTLDNGGDDYLRFLQQIGVDCIDIELGLVSGYHETGCFSREALHALVARFGAFDLRIERANAINSQHLDALFGGPNAAEQRDQLCTMAELLAEVGVPVMGVQCFQAANAGGSTTTGRSWPEGRGGYRYYHFDLAEEEAGQTAPRFTVTAEQLWENLLFTYKQLIPVAERANINVAMHGNDPPLYEVYGNPQILCRFADFDRLFNEVPSPHNTMTFCVGTRVMNRVRTYLTAFGTSADKARSCTCTSATCAARCPPTAATARSFWMKATCTCRESLRRCMRYTTKVPSTSTT